MENQVTVQIAGMPGYVDWNYGFRCYGKWASSTGYHCHVGEGLPEGVSWVDLALHVAVEDYERQKDLMFIIWEEYRENGWHWVEIFAENYEIRLPRWTEPCMCEAMSEIGFVKPKPHMAWCLPTSAMSKAELKQRLAPIMVKGSRFMDQRELAAALNAVPDQGSLF